MRRTDAAVRRGPGRLAGLFALMGATLVAPLASSAPAPEATPAASLREALATGTTSLLFRYRLESVADDAPAVADQDALASTLRTVLGYRTAAFRGVSGAAEFENVTVVGDDAYANGGAGGLFNGVTDRPVVADPRNTAGTRALSQVTAIPNATLRAGRDELAYDDQRFIGPVGFRQHHQTFDAVSARYAAPGGVTLAYDFAWQVNRIAGDNKLMASHFVNASRRMGLNGVSLFYYHLDFDRLADSGASRGTAGIRADGRPSVGDWNVLYDLAYAEQGEVGDNPAQVDATYYRVELGAAAKAGETPITGRVGYERLGGSPADGQFQTPFATLHAFNGWADKFLVTPVNGLTDTYLALGAKPGAFTIDAVYHMFSADEGNADYGTEIDLEGTVKASWGQVFGLAAAFYTADAFAYDTRKVWLWTVLAAR